jgi:hypothetical protein
MILHFSHIGFTEGRTFIKSLFDWVPRRGSGCRFGFRYRGADNRTANQRRFERDRRR